MADENKAPDEEQPEGDRTAEPEPAALPEEGAQQPEGAAEEVEIPSPESAPWPRHLSISLRLLVAGVLLCSVAYPAVVTLAGQALWPAEAHGSIVDLDGQPVGSRLIGQEFASDAFFHPRPSSKGYDGMDSGSQNLGPLNEELTERVAQRLEELEEQGIPAERVPAGWVTESGSALDPHITPAAARLQVPRVSRATGMAREQLEKLIEEHTEGKFIGLFGQQRVNVVLLNLDIRKRVDTTE
ncbi:MAG: potassium-transporting ATPase subunit KdpC [Candidatus Brocadiia bacterium]